MERRRVELGRVQETLLIPLRARADETRRRRPLTRDPRSVEVADALDRDLTRVGGRLRLLGPVFRGVVLDEWVREFLEEHPSGTVVEIGVGLNTRYERLDNGAATWVEIDLPDVIALRRELFAEHDRRRMAAGSATEPDWAAAVAAAPGPYVFVFEAVLIYLSEDGARSAVDVIRDRFPGSVLLMDTVGSAEARRPRAVNVGWSCDDPGELAAWGLRLRDSRTLWDLPPQARARLTPGRRLLSALLDRASRGAGTRLSRFDVDGW
ncbi:MULTISPECIES: class I SAM-dependent methyltransferase [unclassified Streptomyces]|uniref:class I SAM-dependent methyltransferase n=1 Tax=unclassified Streptomyces TaxID=2593676 RepID=UPI00047596F6|nr:class I SAM-dependent methyltransferase [Streptomyces sp. BoleA5]MYX34603.1 class I SAM-dependent methyltransferase [Streptomyces sp. SID8377]